MNEKQQALIEIEKIEPSPLNSYEINDIQDMIGSLKALGLLTPLSIIGPTKDGRYQVVSGERRYCAIKEIRKENPDFYKQVPCYIIGAEDMDENEQRLIIESANLETRDFNKDEHRFNIVAILKKMQEEGKIKQKNIINEMGKYMSGSVRYRRMYQTIFNNGTEETKQLLKNKDIAVHEAAKISSLDKETQKVVADVINSGVDKKDVLDTITRINAEKKEIAKEKEAEKEINLINTDEMGVISRIAEDYEEACTEEDNKPSWMDKDLTKDEFFNKLDSGEYEREELLKLIDESPDYGLEYDTTGTLSSLKDGSSNYKKNNTVEPIHKWCKTMFKRNKFSEDERELADTLEEVAEYIKLTYDMQES